MPAKKFVVPFAATGNKTAVPDTLQPDGTVSYAQGFGPDYELDKTVDPVNAKDVPRDQTNQLFFDVTEAVGELQLYGVALWGADRAPYPINARAYHTGKLWRSNVANNSAEPGTVGSNWVDELAQESGIIVFSTAGVTNWTVPLAMQLGIIKPKVTVIGGGGAGGRINDQSGGGGGGGGAAFGLVNLAGVSSVSVTVGDSGAPQGSGIDGGSGTSSSFGSFMSATGGSGASSGGQGGAGGSGAGGDVQVEGQGGGSRGLLTTGIPSSGTGGSSILSGGGRSFGQVSAITGASAKAGAGGSGSVGAAGAGRGGAGVVIIEW